MITKSAILAAKASAAGGEGPLWDYRTGKLLWLDITNHILHTHIPSCGVNTCEVLPERISRLFIFGDEDYAAAVSGGVARLYKKDGVWKTKRLITLDKNKDILSNDGECDSCGRLVLGLMHKDFLVGRGSLHLCDKNKSYCFNHDIRIPNGVAWSADERDIYIVSDYPKTGLLNYEYEPESGQIGELKEFIDFPQADGMCADTNGNLWITLASRGAVVCFNPHTREITHRVEVPISTTTSCAFGGENMDTLFITTATWGNSVPEFPNRGSLFKAENMGVCGKKSNCFKFLEE